MDSSKILCVALFSECLDQMKKNSTTDGSVNVVISILCSILCYKEECKHCRFCDGVLPSKQPSSSWAVSDVCESFDCQQRAEVVCKKVLNCGHFCTGLDNESTCLPCIHPNCFSKKHKLFQTSEDTCAICHVENLGAAPCIQLECGHIFHFHCAQQKLANKWPGSRMTFGFLNCTLCGFEMKHISLQNELASLLELQAEVKKRAMSRITFDELDKSDPFVNPESRYFKNVELFAEEMLCYYFCGKCETPYFGGLKSCEEILENEEDDRKKELTCMSCVPYIELTDCQVHGTEMIQYKCRFCCSVASFFCFGTTHFCTKCHDNYTIVTAAKPEDLPQCGGKATCPLKMQHPPNGTEEFSLGCGICRTAQDF